MYFHIYKASKDVDEKFHAFYTRNFGEYDQFNFMFTN